MRKGTCWAGLAIALLSAGCPPATPVRAAVEVDPSAPPAVVADGGPAERPSGPACRCDVLDFESDGPPKGRCTVAEHADGTVTWTGETSSPKFSATLTPRAPRPGAEAKAVDYVFEGDFDFACTKPWCGKSKLSVLRVREGDFRVTVARSDDGPPSHVLWFTCAAP